MGFFDTLKSAYNTVSDAVTNPEYLKSKFEEESSGSLVMMYNRTAGTNRDRIKRELIEEILDSRRDGFNYQMQLNKDYVFKQIYSRFSEDELNSEYQYLIKNFTRVKFSINIKQTKLRVLREKLGITKNYDVSNNNNFNILRLLFNMLKLLFRLIIFSIVIILGISLIYFIVHLIKNHFDISLSFNKLQLIYKAVFDKLVTIWPFK